MKRSAKRDIPPSITVIMLFFIGFTTGFSVKGWVNKPIPASHATASAHPKESIEVCFTPNKTCQSKILDSIEGAKKSIFVQAYSFTDHDIATALTAAALRGVEVKVLLDRSNQTHKHSAKNILLDNDVPLRFDAPQGIAHNKIMIIDESTVITGSYNFSAAAYKRNTENLLTIIDASLAKSYLQNWHARWRVSPENP